MIGTSYLYAIIFIGVQPSQVLQIRMEEWQSVKPGKSCNCNLLNANRMQLNRLAVVPFAHPKTIVALNQLIDIQWELHLQLPLSTLGKEPSEELKMICNSIDCFIDKLFSLTSDESSIIDESLTFIEDLMDSGLVKIATPFLVTLLHGTITLSSLSRNRAYQLLIKALTSLQQRGDIMSFEKWFLKVCCEYISTQVELPNLPRTLINLVKFLFENKTMELVSEATESFCSKTVSSCLLEPVLKLYQSQIGLVPADHATRSVIYFIHALISIKKKEKLDFHLGTIMETVWQYPELSNAAAKVVTSLLPCNYFNLINCTRQLMILPNEYDVELYKHEKEIEDKVTSTELSFYDAALWYLDLMVNDQFIHHSHQKVLCLLKAAQYFAKALRTVKVGQDSVPFAFKNAITLLAYDASQLASTCLQPGARNFALATAYRLTCLAANISDPFKHSCLDGRVASGMLRKLFHSSQFTYLLSQPMTLDDFWVASSSYVNKISSLAQQAYIQQLLQIPESLLPMRSALLHYQNMETRYLKGQLDNPQFKELRIVAMSKLLRETKWTFDDVSKAMSTPLLQRNNDGFMKLQEHLGEHLEIAELKGVVFNYNEDSPSVHVIIKPAKNCDGLLSYKDIIEILQLKSDEVSKIVFSLDPPSGTERYHPFMKMRCYPEKLKNTEFMQSLFHADYVLKFLTTGVEVSAKHPFNFKPVQESLIKDLPDSLDFLRRPPYTRGMSHMASHRFWIEVEKVFYDEDITDSHAIYYIDKVEVKIKSRPMVVTLNGNTVDAKHSEYGPHAQFACELTDNYEEISKHFRIFARAKELSKLQFVVQKHHTHLNSLKQKSPRLFESFSKEINRLHSLYPIKSDPNCCLWVPATFNNYVYGGFLCSPKPSHLDYYLRPGADKPTSCSGAEAPDFSDAHKFMQCVRDLEHVGGLKFKIQYQHKVDISPSEIGFVCVRLGEMLSSSHGESFVQSSLSQDEMMPGSANTIQPKLDHTLKYNKYTEPAADATVEVKNTYTQESTETNQNRKEKLSQVEHTTQPSQAVPQSHSTEKSMGSACKSDPSASNTKFPSLLYVGDKTHPQGSESVDKIARGVSQNQINGHDLTMSDQKNASSYEKSVGASDEKSTDKELKLKLQELLTETPSESHGMKDASCLLTPKMPVESHSESACQDKNENEPDLAKMSKKKVEHTESSESAKVTCIAGHSLKPVHAPSTSNSKMLLDDQADLCINEAGETSRSQSTHKDDEQNKDSHIQKDTPESENTTSASEAEPESGSESNTESESESKYKFESQQEPNDLAKTQSTFSVEFDIESVLIHAAKHQILFLKRGTRQDTLSGTLSKSLVNQAIFGKQLNDSKFKDMVATTLNFNETSFHTTTLACHLIKTAIVLRKVVEFHHKQGTEKQIMS